MPEKNEIGSLIDQIIDNEELIVATLSSPFLKEGHSKITIRPIQIKGGLHYQVTEKKGNQTFHQNLEKSKCSNWLNHQILNYKQSFLQTAQANYQILVGKKGHVKILKKPPAKIAQSLMHNREKQYVLSEGEPIPFLVKLGIMNTEGKIYSAKRDKFRQINRFLEMVDDIVPHLDTSLPLRVVDFGCGKAYLTFALYHFLKFTKGLQVSLMGIDLKNDVIQYCQQLALELGYQNDLQFLCTDIDDYQVIEKIDLVVSLHACDTATDAALEKAIRWDSRVILSVPCCQHELLAQIQQEFLGPLLRHGILKERLSALVTDASRVQLLEVFGYQAQIMEFIDVEHTPKNLLIRAVKRKQTEDQKQAAWQMYLQFKNHLHIYPSLERRLQK